MVNIKELTKEQLFSASVRCPKCGKQEGMRVNHNMDYAYHCLECDKNFHAYECPNAVLDHMYKQDKFVPVYGITLRVRSANWYTDNKDALEILYNKYKAASLGCDHYSMRIDNKYAVIDLGWEEPQNDKKIQNFTDDVIKFFSEQEIEALNVSTDYLLEIESNCFDRELNSIIAWIRKNAKELTAAQKVELAAAMFQ